MKKLTVLLWENPNADSSFSAQDLTIQNIEEYDFILCSVFSGNENKRVINTILTVGSDFVLMVTGNGTSGRRYGSWTNENTIHFESAYYDNSQSTTNKYLIPYRIYGLRLF